MTPKKHAFSINVKVAVLLGAADLEGKAYLMNMTQYNGEVGVSLAWSLGKLLSRERVMQDVILINH